MAIDTRSARIAAALPVDDLDAGLMTFTVYRKVPGVQGERDCVLVVDWRGPDGDAGQLVGPCSSRPGIGDPPPGYGSSTVCPGFHKQLWRRGTMHQGTPNEMQAFVPVGDGIRWQPGYQPGPFDEAVAVVSTHNVWDCIHPGAWHDVVKAIEDLGCIVAPIVHQAVQIADNLITWGSAQRTFSCAIIECAEADLPPIP